MQIFRKFSPILIMLVLIIGVIIPTLAQSTGEVELVGTVEAMTLNTVTVNGQEINVSTAEINTAIEVGAIVKVEGTLNTDGTITAREINPVDEGVVPGEAELIGVLDSFDGTTMRVNGQTIDISTAQFNGAIRVGNLVKVHATATGSGMWLARELEPFVADSTGGADDPVIAGEFEVTGTLEQISDGFIVVSGQTISIVGAEVKDPLIIGVLVKVHLSEVNGGLLAREIENANTDDNNNANNNSNANANQNDNANVNQNNNANQNTNDNSNSNDNNSTETQVSAQDAITMVLEIYPNTLIVDIKLDEKFGGTLVWEIHTSHGLEINIDAQSGVILTIESDDDNNNSNANSNNNSNSNDDNSNVNNNSNDNDNNNSNDNDDDNSGMGSDDDDDDDNSGMGSDDD